MSLEGMKFWKKIKLRADSFHHTHEVWGPYGLENTSLRGLASRVLASNWHLHTLILVTNVKSRLGHVSRYNQIQCIPA